MMVHREVRLPKGQNLSQKLKTKSPCRKVADKVVCNGLVEDPAANVARRRGDHGELALVEGAGSNLGAHVT